MSDEGGKLAPGSGTEGVSTDRYVAFVAVGGHWCGFTSAVNWLTLSHLRDDGVVDIVPFVAPPTADFDAVQALSQQAVRDAGYAVYG